MKLVREILRSELGHALSMALVLLLMGGLFVVPVLLLVTTSLKANMMAEENTSELYAADAGVEYGVWTLKYDEEFVLPVEGETPLPLYLPQPTINGIAVQVTLSNEGVDGYKITSAAGGTTIESYVSLTSSLGWLFDSAITCPTEGGVTLMPGTTVTPPESITCPLEVGQTWPEADDLSGFYLEEVEGFTFPDSSIDITDTKSIGPLYRDGSLDIDNTGAPDTLQLTGTIYVTGDLAFEQPGQAHDYTVDLNGQTIFAYDGNSEDENKATITFAPGCTVIGSGCIIAEGDITFQPAATSGPDDFVFIMSIAGKAYVKPGSSFYGAVAGDAEVYLAPHCSLTLTGVPEEGLNFPETSGGGATGGGQVEMLSYTINPP